MKQLTQKLRDGDMLIQEVPVPQLDAGMVMVRLFNFYGIMAIAFIYYMIFHLKKREKAITLKGERKDE